MGQVKEPPPTDTAGLGQFLPDGLGDLTNTQKAIPRIAKDARLTALIEQALPQMPSRHDLYLGDARVMAAVPPDSVHLLCLPRRRTGR